MKTDIYTKVVLTVIALALTGNLYIEIVSWKPVIASNLETSSSIQNQDIIPVRIVNSNMLPVSVHNPKDFEGKSIPLNINSIPYGFEYKNN